MDRDLREGYLRRGLSLEQIGALENKHPSTIGYWVKKQGLTANGALKHAARGGLTREQLEPLAQSGLTLAQIASALDVSTSTVRHWMGKFGLRTKTFRLNRRPRGATAPAVVVDHCRRHGETEFVLEGRGAYRCRRCRSEFVSRRRRKVKRILVEEAGGQCAGCGYDKHPAALHFHHLDPALKAFALSAEGVTRSLEKARAEAKKCVLLCSNCHAEVEAGVAELVLK